MEKTLKTVVKTGKNSVVRISFHYVLISQLHHVGLYYRHTENRFTVHCQLALRFNTIWVLFVLFVLVIINVCIKAISEP